MSKNSQPTSNQKLAGVITVAVVLALLFSWYAYSDYFGNGDADTPDQITVTFTPYEAAPNTDTVVTYYVNGHDVTGQTVQIDQGSEFKVVISGTAPMIAATATVTTDDSEVIGVTTVLSSDMYHYVLDGFLAYDDNAHLTVATAIMYSA